MGRKLQERKYDIFDGGAYLCSTKATSRKAALERFKANPRWDGERWLAPREPDTLEDNCTSFWSASLSERQSQKGQCHAES